MLLGMLWLQIEGKWKEEREGEQVILMVISFQSTTVCFASQV